MAGKEIVFSPNAEREFNDLESTDKKKILRQLDAWSVGEARLDIEKIKSQPSFYRLKIGHIRIVYYPLNASRVVLLLVRDRKSAYRAIPDLSARLQTATRQLLVGKQ